MSPGGDPATFTVALNTQPAADVTITLAQLSVSDVLGDLGSPGAPNADPHLTISPTHLTFTTGAVCPPNGAPGPHACP